jgi:cation:H+ antiporter
MTEPVLILIFSILAVLVSALLYVNSIEFLGYRYKIGGSFVGAILSPLFTSLPELTILLIAVFEFGGVNGSAIGVGTIFGQPFMASSLSYGLVGVLVLLSFILKKRNHSYMEVSRTLAIPFIFVTILFPLTLIPSFFSSRLLHFLFGLVFLFSYLIYLTIMYRRRSLEVISEAQQPYFCRVLRNRELAGFVQLIVSVVILYFGASQLVAAVNQIAVSFGVSVLGLAIIIIPAATAVPETASALIWAFRGKDTLSIGSLVGEKVLYSTLYPAIGLFVTAWTLDSQVYVSVLATSVVSSMMLLFIYRKKIPWYGLILGLAFFAAYVVLTFWLRF